MNKFFCVLTILLSGSLAKSDVLNCYFTEPFFRIEYSMAKQSLTIFIVGEDKPRIENTISFQIKGSGLFEIVNKESKVLLEITLDNEGSDGMSDFIYPFSAKYFGSHGETASILYGACESNYLKRIEFVN